MKREVEVLTQKYTALEQRIRELEERLASGINLDESVEDRARMQREESLERSAEDALELFVEESPELFFEESTESCHIQPKNRPR